MTVYHITNHILVMMLSVGFIVACGPGYDAEDAGVNPKNPVPNQPSTNNFTNQSGNHTNPGHFGNYGNETYVTGAGGIKIPTTIAGWKLPPGMVEQWVQWVDNYQKELEKNGSHIDMSNWPPSFQDLGAGHAGFPPLDIPPWGYKPKHTGLPHLCYLPLDIGKCNETKNSGNDTKNAGSMRWAYNAYTQSCEQFEYFGCGGNENNFSLKLTCLNKCTNPTNNECDPETNIWIGSRRCGGNVKSMYPNE